MQKTSDLEYKPNSRIILPGTLLETITAHCRRKLAENYLASESRERKAFGLIAGRKSDSDLLAEKCFPLLKNVRQLQPYAKFMDQAMQDYGIPSETPFAKRGWIAEPQELLARIKQIKQDNLCLLGAYHMHRVAWPDDPLRDMPTTLDTVLAADSGIIIFIISMVNPNQPLIRAFFEGRPDRELPIVVTSLAK